MAKIINGKKIAEKIKDQLVQEIIELKDQRPNLAIILVGEREDSKLYVSLKEIEAKKVGIDTHLYKCASNIPEREIFDMIDCLNKDDMIDAILVQLPLPEGYDTDGIIRAIDPAKDVDRFHPANIEILLSTCSHQHVMPPVFEVVLEMLREIKYNLKDKLVCVLGNSELFCKSLAKVLECQKAQVDIVRVDDGDFLEKTKKANVLITALGKPEFIKKDMIKKDVVIIDIGITKKNDKVYGDADFTDVKDMVGYISPVPGGVGPATIAMTFKNTLELYKQRRKFKN